MRLRRWLAPNHRKGRTSRLITPTNCLDCPAPERRRMPCFERLRRQATIRAQLGIEVLTRPLSDGQGREQRE